MKKLLSLILTVILTLTLCACGSASISAEQALDIALEQAGVTKDNITNLESKLERDDGMLVYEIDFDVDNVEYSFDINADTGAIIERDRDRID